MILMEQGGLNPPSVPARGQAQLGNQIGSARNQQARIASAGLNEGSIIYNNQSLVIDQLPEDKKQKVALGDPDPKRDQQPRMAGGFRLKAPRFSNSSINLSRLVLIFLINFNFTSNYYPN